MNDWRTKSSNPSVREGPPPHVDQGSASIERWLSPHVETERISSDVVPRRPAQAPGSRGDAPRAGERIGRFVLGRQLGEVGMGLVFEAYDPELDRSVALKVLRASPTVEMRARLLREARTLARLAHPNVVTVFDVGEEDGRVFLAMELVRGCSLRDWLRAERRWDIILQAFVQAGRGLHAAHEAGLVHRDFKPANVSVGEDGRVRVLDFGLACDGEDGLGSLEAPGTPRSSIDLTSAGTILGTPAYMSPEHFTGGSLDRRADQFSFCVSLYEALLGRRPFTGRTLPELRDAVLNGALRVPWAARELPESLWSALSRGLTVRREERFPSLQPLLDVLEAAAVAPCAVSHQASCQMNTTALRWLAARYGFELGLAPDRGSAESRAAPASLWAPEPLVRARLELLHRTHLRAEARWFAELVRAFRAAHASGFGSFVARSLCRPRPLNALAHAWDSHHRGTKLQILAVGKGSTPRAALLHPAHLFDGAAALQVQAELMAALSLQRDGACEVSLVAREATRLILEFDLG